eukprot:GFKZ01012500.1.p1 GENE.GFKZ01012500.1~~GFKZ01012500.1.p1  ORF type:complete len:115 (-),score=4.53 GFKZ01012500.1:508-852(-)
MLLMGSLLGSHLTGTVPLRYRTVLLLEYLLQFEGRSNLSIVSWNLSNAYVVASAAPDVEVSAGTLLIMVSNSFQSIELSGDSEAPLSNHLRYSQIIVPKCKSGCEILLNPLHRA